MHRLVILCALFISGLANPHFERDQLGGRIVGGHDVSIKDAPYQVAIVGDTLCGGSIISKNLVLTAAHCFENESSESSTIWAGSKFLQRGSMHAIKKVYKHEKFAYIGNTPFNDIAIVKVSNDFELDETRKSIALFSSGAVDEADTLAVATGWGTTSYKGEISLTLKSVTLPIMSKYNCNKAYYGGLPRGQICTSKRGMDACQGDSGGPLAINGTLAGIVSWGKRCASKYPGAYTEVAYYRHWIESTIEKLNKG